jgi:pectate lyase
MKNIFLLLILLNTIFTNAQIAFPGAEGGGKYTVGGRGGIVIEVTNLNASGPGSLKEACEASGARTIVFKTGGTIDLDGETIDVYNDSITIAGQTAPGDGIQIKNGGFTFHCNQIIMRYLRVRLGPVVSTYDAISVSGISRYESRHNAIFDHISAFWGVDETFSVGNNFDSLTVQWSIIAEGLHCSSYTAQESWDPCKYIGDTAIWAHSRGIMITFMSQNTSMHHNLIYNSYKRNPLIQSSDANIVNNVMVNYNYQAFLKPYKAPVKVNFIGNYFRSYAHNRPPVRVFDMNQDYDSLSAGYYYDNYDSYFRPNSSYPDSSIRIRHQNAGDDGNFRDTIAPFPFPEIETQAVQEAYVSVLESSGCNFPIRDEADERVIDFVESGGVPTAFVDDPNEVGGWPQLNNGTAPIDTDHDGMPDFWEIENNLDINNPDDRNNTNLSPEGYTNLEVYINGLLDNPIPSNRKQLNLKAYLGGAFLSNNMSNILNSKLLIPNSQPYNGDPWFYFGVEEVNNLPNENVIDWVLVEIRDANSASLATVGTIIAQKAGFILQNGQIVDIDGVSNLFFDIDINHELFVVVYHRNHLPIISANPLINDNGTFFYDFTDSAEKAYGGDQAQLQLSSSIFGMYPGDINADGIINDYDYFLWKEDAGKEDYLSSDLFLNGVISNQDKNDNWFPNLNKCSQVPQ